MNSQAASTFATFFEAVHGYPPFPWQIRLAERVVSEGRWPGLLDLPTGTGKTSAIDVALFALSRRPDVFPRRIVLVVDRRVVVDQGAEHARSIQTALKLAEDGPAREVADALRRLFGGKADDLPFVVSVMRGGMPRDEAWADRPDRAVVALSTVDQAGSRLLFRGYGVSPRMAPIHAGLLGNDTLFLLDEVQLSTAFAETLQVLQRRWRPWRSRDGGVSLPDRWGAVRMSATPIGDDDQDVPPLRLDADDRRDPVLAKRLGARKMAAFELVKVSREEDDRAKRFAEACAAAAARHISAGARAVAIVVNRVDTARRVHRLLHDETQRQFDVALLTGRIRPLDRVEILGKPADPSSLACRIIAGRARVDEARPIVVVATQCIEAGADFDFDALVTECASLDALRQRFGRVDRRGELGESRSTILARHDQIDVKADDPIYGRALAATWKWLEASGGAERTIDFGDAGFPPLPEDEAESKALSSMVVRAPVLLPAHLDAWAQTNPRPEPDPDVALWLHGPARGIAEVRLVWRSDVDERSLTERGPGKSQELLAQLTVAPPSSLESISVPLPAARAWLMRRKAESFGDVEGMRSDADDRASRPSDQLVARLCVRARRNAAEIIRPEEIRPGDTLVVPSGYGGIAHGSWDPTATTFVSDLGDWAQLVHRGRPVLRLVPEVLAGAVLPDAATDLSEAPPPWCSARLARNAPRAPEVDDENFDAARAIREWIDSARAEVRGKLKRIIQAIAPEGGAQRYRRVEIGDGRFALVGKKRVDPRKLDVLAEDAGEIITEDDDSSSFIGVELGLRRHLSDVREQTHAFASQLGIEETIAADLALAAWLHDIGKADRRFQQILVGGNELRLALQREPLAKSAGDAKDALSRIRARDRSGYPRGYRHELLSVAMLEHTPEALDKAHDRDLVLHLVGSHHGWCRPFAPAVDHGPSLNVELELDGVVLRADAAHGLARLDSGIADRYFNLVDRYGWWGLAWLEAIMRLADHRASEAARAVVVDENEKDETETAARASRR